MENLKCLLIGDPHFKSDNTIETNLMHTQIVQLVYEKNPDMVIIMGDTLHSHETINTICLNRAVFFLQDLQKISKHLVIIIGNHDYINNDQFLSDKHPFNMCKLWEKTTVVDDIIELQKNKGNYNYKFLFAPYVFVGRFEEALKTKNLDIQNLNYNAVFSHQEYHGSKMNGLSGKTADLWPLGAPVNFSGHEHNREKVQDNLIYIGTPIQHSFSDTFHKTLSLVSFYEENHEEELIKLNIPRKFIINLTPEELSTYIPPENILSLKIKVHGNTDLINKIFKLKNVKKMLNDEKIKIQIIDTGFDNKIKNDDENRVKTQISFLDRLKLEISKKSKEVQEIFKEKIMT